jgi:succinate-semialdehyde dehydrogenase/glutarate-semialdehyde dehydrogenase
VSIRSFRGDDEAVAMANESNLGLCASIFSRDLPRAEGLARRLEFGTVTLNDVLYAHALPEAPWGGWKHSGVGRVHGLQGLKNMCQVRHVSAPRVRWTPPWTFPYRDDLYRRFLGMCRYIVRSFLAKLIR